MCLTGHEQRDTWINSRTGWNPSILAYGRAGVPQSTPRKSVDWLSNVENTFCTWPPVNRISLFDFFFGLRQGKCLHSSGIEKALLRPSGT